MKNLDEIQNKVILAVDDDIFFLEIVKLMLENIGFLKIETARSYDEAKRVLAEKEIDLVLLDIELDGDKSGIDIARDIQAMQIDLPIVFMTATYDEAVYESAKETNPFSFLNKNMSQIQLRQAVELPLAAQIKNAAKAEAQKEALDANTRIKEEFIASMNHQIRTPMNSIVGLTELLLESAPSQFQDTLKDLQFAGDNLMKLLKDIIDLSQLKQGQVYLKKENFDLETSLQALIIKHKEVHKNPQVSLQLFIDGEVLQHYLIGDIVRLQQVLNHLIDNSLKFTATGSVSLKATIQKITTTEAHLRLEVIDTGIGISKGKIALIFESFSQMADVKEQQFGGSGMGLSIAQHLVELHQTTLQVKSKEEKGSTFYFDIPLPLGNLLKTPLEEQLDGIRILLVEDNLLNQKLAQKALEQKGVEVTTADNGAIALEAIQKTNFDMVLMDLNMPVMDGLEATRKIRALATAMAQIPIIVVTASSAEQVQSQMNRLGINALLSKPFKPQELYELINQTLEEDKS